MDACWTPLWTPRVDTSRGSARPLHLASRATEWQATPSEAPDVPARATKVPHVVGPRAEEITQGKGGGNPRGPKNIDRSQLQRELRRQESWLTREAETSRRQALQSLQCDHAEEIAKLECRHAVERAELREETAKIRDHYAEEIVKLVRQHAEERAKVQEQAEKTKRKEYWTRLEKVTLQKQVTSLQEAGFSLACQFLTKQRDRERERERKIEREREKKRERERERKRERERDRLER